MTIKEAVYNAPFVSVGCPVIIPGFSNSACRAC
jgi:hypothetical protein